MKNVVYTLALAVLTLICCTEQKKNPSPEKDPPNSELPLAGADQDEYGCKTSAGYTWSILKNVCIKVFVQGIRLDPKLPELDSTLSAFIVFKDMDEDQQAEIFIPNKQKSLILNRVEDDGAGTWNAGELTLRQWRGMYTLDQGDKTIYQGPAVR